MQLLYWLLLLTFVVGAVIVWAVARRQNRQRDALWGAPPEDEDFGVSEARPLPATRPEPLPLGPAEPALAEPVSACPDGPAPAPANPLLPDDETLLPLTEDRSPDPLLSDDEAMPEPATPMFLDDTEMTDDLGSRLPEPPPEWETVPGTSALLRSLLSFTGGSAAILLDEDGDVYAVAAAGPVTGEVTADAPRLSRRAALDDLPATPATVILGDGEPWVLTRADRATTAVRLLAAAPAPRHLLVVETPEPLDSRAETLIGHYADLLAEVMGLLTDPPPPAPDADPLAVAMEALEGEMAASRESGRALALAIVVPYEAESLVEGDPEAVASREAALRERLSAVAGTRNVLPMGALVLGAVCDVDGGGAERWVRALTEDGATLRIGMAVYGPRHVSPDLLRQDAAQALRQTYAGEDTCVIVE